jgi:hypothetical protein
MRIVRPRAAWRQAASAGYLGACINSRTSAGGVAMNISTKEAVEWGSAILVFASGGMAGHYAALGMSPMQWAGAAAAVLGSVTLAVCVRVWPAEQKASAQAKD